MLKMLRVRSQALVDAETNLSSPAIFADAASKETTSINIYGTDHNPAVQIAVRPSAAMFFLFFLWSDMHIF